MKVATLSPMCMVNKIISTITDGKTAMKAGLAVFMQAAKTVYSKLSDSELDALSRLSEDVLAPKALSYKQIVREGVKAFRRIQKEVSKECMAMW